MNKEYQAEIVLRLLPIAVSNLTEFKDLKENDDFCRFFSNSLPVGYLKCDNESTITIFFQTPSRIWLKSKVFKENDESCQLFSNLLVVE